MLRAAVQSGRALGKRVQAVMDSGALVSDEIMIDLVKQRIMESDCVNGFLFDGFPRTIPQARALDAAGIVIDAVVEIQVDDETLVKRITGRRVHPGSGRVYHVQHNPPKVMDRDDETGEPLVQREDDNEDTVRERLGIYQAQTAPLVAYYKGKESQGLRYLAVDGTGSVDEIQAAIGAELHTG
jgi:adenylate kinase